MSRRDGKRPVLTREDRRLWDEVRRSVTPLRRSVRQTETEWSPLPAPDKGATAPPPPMEPGAKPVLDDRPARRQPAVIHGIDDKTVRRLKKGRLEIEARIDLHGMGEMQAYHALRRFLENARRHNRRIVLVITGKGERSGGILRNAVPRWFREPPFAGTVAACRLAHASHGGEGALYVRLRRPSDGRNGSP